MYTVNQYLNNQQFKSTGESVLLIKQLQAEPRTRSLKPHNVLKKYLNNPAEIQFLKNKTEKWQVRQVRDRVEFYLDWQQLTEAQRTTAHLLFDVKQYCRLISIEIPDYLPDDLHYVCHNRLYNMITDCLKPQYQGDCTRVTVLDVEPIWNHALDITMITARIIVNQKIAQNINETVFKQYCYRGY